MDIEVFALYDKYGDINLTIELFRLLVVELIFITQV